MVISAASGTGKTSLCLKLLESDELLVSSVSHTTRQPRGGEKDGREYFFVTEQVFDEMISRGAFLEWAEVYGNRYGTSVAPIECAMTAGFDVLLDIDVQGAFQVRRCLEGAVLVFLLPPSLLELRRRLVERREDALHVIERRLVAAKAELVSASRYDYLVVNRDLSEALEDLRAILYAHRLEQGRVPRNSNFRGVERAEALRRDRPDELLRSLIGDSDSD